MNKDIIVAIVSASPLVICTVIWIIVFKINRKTNKTINDTKRILNYVEKRLASIKDLLEVSEMEE